jgi:hypothetical protein
MQQHTAAALTALSDPAPAATAEVPAAPGLYAVHAHPHHWLELGLSDPPDDRPLYVGKSEKSLASRDLRTHFATGRTGSSTLRRSLAGLLAGHLNLHAQPRNIASPSHYDKFGLEPAGDQRLTDWMLTNLRLAVWPSPAGSHLDAIETAVLQRLFPPLNLSKVTTPWSAQIAAARRTLAQQALAWRPTN